MKPAQALSKEEFRLGHWLFIPAAYMLRQGALERSLTPQQMRLLWAFIEADEHCLSKQAMVEQVWSGRVVTDDAIARAVSELRKQLASEEQPETIQTLHGHGYRLAVAVRRNIQAPPLRQRVWLLAGAVVALAVTAALWRYPGGSSRPPLQPLPLRLVPLHGELPAERSYLPVPGVPLWYQHSDGVATLHRQGNDEPLWQAPGRILGAVASPQATRVALAHRDQQCRLIGVDLSSGRQQQWANCSGAQPPAFGWAGDDILLSARIAKSGELEIAELPWAGAPQVRRLPAEQCVQPLQIARVDQRDPLLSCRSSNGAVLYRLGRDGLQQVLVNRSIRLWVEDAAGRIYFASNPAWQPGLTRYDPSSESFAYAQTGWIAALGTAQGELIAVRDRGNLDLLAMDLQTLAQLTIEDGERMSLAFGVDQSSGALWQLDDRAGDLAIYAQDQVRLQQRDSELDLSQVVGIAVDQAAGWMVLSSQDAGRYEHHWLTVEPMVRLARFEAGSAELRIVDGAARYLRADGSAGAFDLSNAARLAGSEWAPAAPGHCPGSPLPLDGNRVIEILRSDDGVEFAERDAGHDEPLRRWRDSRITRPCGLINPTLDPAQQRLIYALQRQSAQELVRIEPE